MDRGGPSAGVALLSNLPARLRTYAAEGQRRRRFARLRRISQEVSTIDVELNQSLVDAVSAFRIAVEAAEGWESHTDAAIFEAMLLGGRAGFGPISPTYSRRNVARGQVENWNLPGDPVLLLGLHIKANQKRMWTGDLEPYRAIDWAVGALGNEMIMLARAEQELADLLDAVTPTSPSHIEPDAQPPTLT